MLRAILAASKNIVKNSRAVKNRNLISKMATIPKKPKVSDASNLVWIDCEMTGLDERTDHLLEIAVIVTDKDLNILGEGPNLVIHQPDEVFVKLCLHSSKTLHFDDFSFQILNSMNEWCIEHHGDSGLTEKVRQSQLSVSDCQTQILDFLKDLTPPGKCPLAGNSVGEDKRFLTKYMPELMKHLHYRIVDVSTVKELVRRWHPKDFSNKPEKKLAHRALDDIKESIEELKYYRSAVFKE